MRGIRILHHAYQLSAVRNRSIAPDPLVWNTPAFGVSSDAEIIRVERDDGDQGLPSDPVGHRSAEHVPPPSPTVSPQQNEVSVLFLSDPDDFLNRSARGHHRVYAGLPSWWNQGVELPARFLTKVAANKLLIERETGRISARIDHVPQEEWTTADGVTADRRPLDHVEEDDDTSPRRCQFNAIADRRQRRFGEIRRHQNAGRHFPPMS